MNIMYIAPRYHTNQVPVVRGLIKKGIKVRFLSQYAGKVEDYSDITPVILGYSCLYTGPAELIGRLRHTDPKVMSDKRIKHGIPPMGAVKRQIQDFKPDLCILRERSMYTIAAYSVCRRMHVKAILYNQSPLYEDEVKNDFAHRMVRRLVPDIRMTPVLGEGRSDQVTEPGSVYVPFVMEQQFDPDERLWLRDGILHIFTVGKYEKRKNLMMMADVTAELMKNRELLAGIGVNDVHLTIAGECSTDAHKAYLAGLTEHISGLNLDSKMTLLQNLSREEMAEEYRSADLFVLPSTAEPASISQLEAMSYGLPVICSDKNGTACHVEPGVNGCHFKDNDGESLLGQISDLLKSRPLREYGAASYRLVAEKYSIDIYLETIMQSL